MNKNNLKKISKLKVTSTVLCIRVPNNNINIEIEVNRL